MTTWPENSAFQQSVNHEEKHAKAQHMIGADVSKRAPLMYDHDGQVGSTVVISIWLS